MPRKWLTPNTPAPNETRCRSISVPDDLSLVASVTGALLPLTSPDNWEKYGSMTPEEAASIMSASFDAFVASECGGGCSLPGFDPPVKVYRRNPTTGRIEWQNNGVWEEPTGDYAIPDPDARPEATDALKECGAASNAAESLRVLYSNILSVYDAEVDPIINQTEIAAQIAVAIGSMFGPVSASFLSLSGLAWDVFTQALDEITEDDWSDAFQEELVCILNSASVVTDGVVTFDFFTVCSELVGFILPVIDEFVRVRWQTWYLLQCIGEQGLNVAGATTSVQGDCVTCDTWCVMLEPGYFNPTLTQGYLTAEGGVRQTYTSPSWAINGTVTVDTTYCTITRFGMEFTRAGIQPASNTLLQFTPSGISNTLYTLSLSATLITGDNPQMASNSNTTTCLFQINQTQDRQVLLNKLIFYGTGINPFGVGSNC